MAKQQRPSRTQKFSRDVSSGGARAGKRASRDQDARSGERVAAHKKNDSSGQMIEGKNSIIEALRARVPLKKILIARGLKDDKGIDEIARRAQEAGIVVESVDRRELDRMSDHGSHQGVAALIAPFAYTPLAQILDAAAGKESALIIALDHITDPGNFGAIARSAEVIGAAGIIVPSRRSAAVTAAAYKSSAGALAHLPIAQETNLVRSLEACKEQGFWVVGASEEAEQLLWDAPLEGRIVLVMGSEGEGLSRLSQETCDLLVRLPQQGNIGSLNVAQAATALSYEWLRRTHLKGGDV